jgi:hypothetical protein
VSEHFQSDLEKIKERSIRNDLAAVRDYAVLGSRDHDGLIHHEKCGVIPCAQQQFGGSDDSANQDRRSNSEGFEASISHS